MSDDIELSPEEVETAISVLPPARKCVLTERVELLEAMVEELARALRNMGSAQHSLAEAMAASHGAKI